MNIEVTTFQDLINKGKQKKKSFSKNPTKTVTINRICTIHTKYT